MRTSASGESALLLLDVVRVLGKEQVDYAIVGAMAASVYGVIRASRDADALLSISVPALAELEQTFRAAGFHTELRRGDFDDPIGAVLTLQDSFDNQVDLLVGIRGFDPEAFSRSIEVSLYGEPLKFVSLEDFIAMKVFAGGPVRRTSPTRRTQLNPPWSRWTWTSCVKWQPDTALTQSARSKTF